VRVPRTHGIGATPDPEQVVVKNFLIVGTQRTGSSAFAEAIGFHPEIACGWESTHRIAWYRRFEVAEQFFKGDIHALEKRERAHMQAVYGPDVRCLGFRRLFRASNKWIIHPSVSPALWIDRMSAHRRWLAKHPEVHVIHIVRCDNVAWLRSKFFSRESDLYVGKEYPEGMNVRIPVHEAVARVRSKRWVDENLAGIQRTNPYIRVLYEDFLRHKTETVAGVVRFLECDPAQLGDIRRRGRKKQAHGEVSGGISNYLELVRVLTGAGLLEYTPASL